MFVDRTCDRVLFRDRIPCGAFANRANGVTPQRQHVGWDEYRIAFQGMFAALKGPVGFTIHDLQVTSSGDIAYSCSLQEVTAQMAKGGTRHVVVRVTDVLRKINGHWLIVQERVSVPVDVNTGKADLLSRP
ncbi:MAG: YybH family protein [Vulcanimicrobiaceae bacterium]